jgi:hypothetical protein
MTKVSYIILLYSLDNGNDEYDDKNSSLNVRKGKKNNSDAEDYVIDSSDKPSMSKGISGEKQEDAPEEHSEVVYADSKSHSFRFEVNPDDDMKEDSELAKDNVPTYEMNMSLEDRTDPIYVAHESDSSSKDENLRRRELKRQQKYGVNEFSAPKVMPYNNPHMYNEPFPVFCGDCSIKVDTTYMPWICRGHCGKVYHDRCKKNLESNPRNRLQIVGADPRKWICWICREGKAECFICKKIDYVKPNPKKPLPPYVINMNSSSINSYSPSHYSSQRENTTERQRKDDLYLTIDQDDAWKLPEKKAAEKKPFVEEPKPKEEENKETEFKFQFESQSNDVGPPVS